jgi:chitinase
MGSLGVRKRSLAKHLAIVCATAVVGTLVGTALGAQDGQAKTKKPVPATSKTATKKSPSPRSRSLSRWITAYHVGYQSQLWPADRIDFTAISHFVVGRVKPRADGSIATDFDIDDKSGPLFAADMAARARKAKRIPLLMLGGAGEHDPFASALSPTNRDRFVTKLLRLSNQWGYAGFELDFEPLTPADEPTIEWFINELRRRKPGVVLTIPIGWLNPNTDVVRPFYARIANLVDQMNVMTYGMSGPWGWPTWHSSALTGSSGPMPSSVESSVNMYLAAGVPAAKLGVGIGFSGQCWQKRTGPRQAQDDGILAAEDSMMSSAIIAAEYAPKMQRVWDADAQVPYLTSTTAVGKAACQYISYEDPQSVAAKASFVKRKQLGGVIIWTAGQGYVAASGTNPMLSATYDSMLG